MDYYDSGDVEVFVFVCRSAKALYACCSLNISEADIDMINR